MGSGYFLWVQKHCVYTYVLEMMSLISKTLMYIKGLEYAVYGMHEPDSIISITVLYMCAVFKV